MLHTYACVDDIDSDTHACMPTLTNAICRVNSQQVCRHAVAQSSGWVPQLQMDSVGSVQHLPAPRCLIGDARTNVADVRWLQVRTEIVDCGNCTIGFMQVCAVPCSIPLIHPMHARFPSHIYPMHAWCVCTLE